VPNPKKRGSQTVGTVHYRSFNAKVYDTQSLLKSFGINRLSDAGTVVKVPKLDKPPWLGLRKWKNDDEHREFIAYAAQDAIITSKIVRWLHDNFNADPAVHASAGTLAKDVFALPRRLPRVHGFVHPSWLETRVRNATFAGRSECFRNGYISNTVYNDVASLYPVCASVCRALEITGATPCPPEDLDFAPDAPLDTRRYGWLEGTFESYNDLWGLPMRLKNNVYATGVITGLFHIFDLLAAQARVLHVSHAFKPVFEPSTLHEKFVTDTINRVEGRLQGTEKTFKKAVLNALTGKLGQAKPTIAETSNFFAYHTIVAHAHAVMSRLFDKCPTEIYGMDTDSIFSETNMSGKWFELSDGEHSIPVKMDMKGRGDLAFFRSKNYILRARDNKGDPVYARHGWVYWYDDYIKLHDGTLTELTTRKDVKHTLQTRVLEAKKLALGRWRTKPVTLTLEKIKALLKGDMKRRRVSYDSYALVMQHRSKPSQAWNYEDLLFELEVEGCAP
jgi:hypothetical protein